MVEDSQTLQNDLDTSSSVVLSTYDTVLISLQGIP